VLAQALAAGELSSKGDELNKLLHDKRQEIMEWLQERCDITERHANRLETVEWAILIFVILGVVVDLLLLFHDK
jgi:hypothetical protein